MKRPFVGEYGKLLFQMLGEAMPQEFPELHAAATAMFRYGLAWAHSRDAWLDAVGITMTNVLAFRPPDNKLETLCVDKKESGKDYPYQPAAKGKYLKSEYFGELTRLREEIEISRPNLILTMGNTALWALCHTTNIGSVRGAIASNASDAPFNYGAGIDNFVIGKKVLATYHPAAVMRQWSWRPIVVADLMKAHREMQFPEVRRPQRQIAINPTLAEFEVFVQEMELRPPALLSVDIETGGGMIKCIGFAPSRGTAMVIPLCDPRSWRSVWTHGEELRVWELIKQLLESDIPKLGQNFLYDLQYILKMGIRPQACLHDTMLLHHSHFPEMQKGLGFLASIYTNESAWKLMNRHKPDSVKRDE